MAIIPQIDLRTGQNNNEKLTSYRELNTLCFLEICVNRLKNQSQPQATEYKATRQGKGHGFFSIGMVRATDSFTVGCDTGFPILPLSQFIRQLTVHSWVWLRPEERADLVMCLKDTLLRLRVSYPGERYSR